MPPRFMPHTQKADQILTHYITLVMEQAGCRVDGDTYAELNHLIGNAIREAVDVAVQEAVTAIEQRMAATSAIAKEQRINELEMWGPEGRPAGPFA